VQTEYRSRELPPLQAEVPAPVVVAMDAADRNDDQIVVGKAHHPAEEAISGLLAVPAQVRSSHSQIAD
jgi:hypothetical protein